MNKRVLITSLVLILALILVLVTGKTENAIEPKPAHNVVEVEATPLIDLNADVAMLSYETNSTSWQANALNIPSEVNESELILEQELLPARTLKRRSTTYLADSLQRLQLALDGLEQAAASAEQAVKAIENRISSG